MIKRRKKVRSQHRQPKKIQFVFNLAREDFIKIIMEKDRIIVEKIC